MWPRLVNIALGIWLMAAPTVLDYGAPASDNDRIVGPLVVMFGCVALWEATRPLRWLVFLLGLWQIAAPFVLGYPTNATINAVVVGLAWCILGSVRGKVTQRFAGGWSMLWKSKAEIREAS